jgi:hypothetical protein
VSRVTFQICELERDLPFFSFSLHHYISLKISEKIPDKSHLQMRVPEHFLPSASTAWDTHPGTLILGHSSRTFTRNQDLGL